MGVSNLGDLVATATLDISPFATNTNQLKMLVRGLDSQLKIVENSFKGQKNKLEGLKASHTQLGKVLEGNRALFANQARHYQNLKMETGSLNTATKEQKIQLLGAKNAMEATAAKVAELQNKYNALAREIATQSSVWTKIGTNLAQSGNELKAFGDATAGVGKALTAGLTVPIMAGAGYAVKAAVQYESAFAGVKKTVDETATTSYEKLSAGIRNMSKQLPASAAQIARVAEVSGQLGISADNVLGFTKVMIDMGESTNLSAEDAATAIAKIANITGMSADQYQRFGSSLVALGNNFATTEADILQMANRMASAGTIAGLTNQEILGLATAMSSVGIEAEMGGSAMSQTLVAIEKAVATGSDKLQGFADIAGMTADRFTEKWKSSPAEALQAFITGLGELDKKGESATLKLDELGLSGIRQSNMLKSLSSASDMMTQAITMSNDAWDKNRDLTDEASKRYETTESKLKILRNEVTDVAIEFGGPLVDALRDALKAGKPWIKAAADMAKSFSELDREQQQQILKWGMIAASAGPALSILGNGIGVIGSVFKGVSKVTSTLGKVSGALQTGTPLLEMFSGSATAATTATTGLSGAVGILGNPITWGVLLGGAALATVGYFAWQANEATKRAREWGTEVDAVQANELSKFKTKVDETNVAMELFANSKDGVEQIKGSVDKVKQAFDELAKSINKSLDEQLNKDLEIAKKFGFSDEAIADMQRQNEQVKSNIIDMSEQVKAIYEKHGSDMSKLNQAEKDLVLRNQREMINKQLDVMKFSNEEKKALQAALNNDLDKLNSMQLEKVITNTDSMAKKEKEAYQKNKDELLKLMESYGDKQSTAYKEAQQKLEDLEADHTLKMLAYNDQWLKAQKARIDDMKANGESSEQTALRQMDVVDEIMERYGVGQKAAEDMLNTALDTNNQVGTYLSNISSEASESVKKANEAWDDLFTSSNPSEKLKEMLSSADGWNQLKIMAKDVDVNPVGRAKLAEMLVESDKWNEMTYEEKQLIVDGSTAWREIFDSKELLAQWNALTPEQKAIVAENKVAEPTMTAQQMIDSVRQPVPAKVFAEDATKVGTDAASRAINTVKQSSPAPIKASDKTEAGVSQAKKNIDGVQGKSVDIWVNIKKAASDLWDKLTSWETGTNFHPGGLAMVNDQKGPLYRELITLPNGNSFIPEGRDVVLPLPRGTKVLKASETRKLFPRYENGIGFENTGIAKLTERMNNISETNIVTNVVSENEDIKLLLSRLVEITNQSNSFISQLIRGVNDIYDKPSYLVLDDGTLVARTGDKFAEYHANQERRNNRLKGIVEW